MAADQTDTAPPLARNARAPRGMAPHNHPDMALLQEWLHDLEVWRAAHGLQGYDPFDVKAHPVLRALQTRPLLRKASTVLCDFAPYLTRRALGIQPAHNPKAYALVALGALRLYQITGDAYHADVAREHLQWLLDHPGDSDAGLAWGYPFPVRGTGVDSAPGTPVAVVSCIAGEAFELGYSVLGDGAYADASGAIATFCCEALPRLAPEGGDYCFAYTPADRRRIHNANLLVVEHLLRVHARTGDAAPREAALPALQFTLDAQGEDGSWPYGACAACEPFEPGLMALVDHYHTGFVLRSLFGIWQTTGDARCEEAMNQGYTFYRRNCFGAWGLPRNAHNTWPVDIHAAAEGVLCPAMLSVWRRSTLMQARDCMRWTYAHLRDPDTYLPWYRKYPWFTSKLLCTRWGFAWLYRALAEYCYRLDQLEAPPDA